jgi:hypothetical protein
VDTPIEQPVELSVLDVVQLSSKVHANATSAIYKLQLSAGHWRLAVAFLDTPVNEQPYNMSYTIYGSACNGSFAGPTCSYPIYSVPAAGSKLLKLLAHNTSLTAPYFFSFRRPLYPLERLSAAHIHES